MVPTQRTGAGRIRSIAFWQTVRSRHLGQRESIDKVGRAIKLAVGRSEHRLPKFHQVMSV